MLHVLRRRPRSSGLQQAVVRATRCPNPPPILLRHASSTLTSTPGGLSLLRTESAAATVPAILAEAEAAWQQQQNDVPATMRVLLLHDELDDPEAMESNVPTLGATAERNQLLDTDMVTGAKEGEEKEMAPAAKGKIPSPSDDPTTATCISVGVPNAEEIVLFRSHDASFPTLRRKGSASATGTTDVSSSLAEMVMKKQPRVLLVFGEPQFPLAELSSRLESIFDKSHVMAAYARGVLPALRPPRILALGGGDTPAPADDNTSCSSSSSSSSSGSNTPQAVGLALFGENALSTEDVGRLACSLFGSSWLGNFSLDERLTRHLFVPSNITLGKQPPCGKYQALEETHAHNLPLFRLHSVLFPGCSLMLKIFEPRYRRMVKMALERNEPFGLLNADASVGTLASITEVYRMEEDTGISILKITGTRRFEVQASHVADDSFGLLHATTAKFFEEDPVEDIGELESLRVQARACLASSLAAASASAMGPPPPSFLMQTGQQQQQQQQQQQGEEGREAAVVLAEESFVLSQWLVDSYQSVLPERKKMEWLRTTSTTTRMRDCLDLLLSVVRRGRGGGGGGGGGGANGGGGTAL